MTMIMVVVIANAGGRNCRCELTDTRLRKRKREDFVDKSDDSGSDDEHVSRKAIEEWKSAAGFSTRSKRSSKSKVGCGSLCSADRGKTNRSHVHEWMHCRLARTRPSEL